MVWIALLLSAFAERASAELDNFCGPGEAPDLVVANIHATHSWATWEGIVALSLGTVSCNIGTCQANWISTTPEHPVIGQNMFRLEDGRFEQIGQSWLKHGFTALAGSFCFDDCIDGGGDHLGVHCADPYSAVLNGVQFQLGPKFEVNPVTGQFPYPATDMSLADGPLHKRLQVHVEDLDPAWNNGASYFAEAQYVTADDGSPSNNASYRQVEVVALPNGFYELELLDQTVIGQPAIRAWAAFDPSVLVTEIDVPGDGRFVVAAKASDLGTGYWRYEYAVQNTNSHRAARSFSVAASAVTRLAQIGFHDVDYHSGEPFDGTDWERIVGPPDSVTWATHTYSEDPYANALRWGTLYNFRFDADAPPTLGTATLGLFLPSADRTTDVSATTITPRMCDHDGVCDPGETCSNCAGDCIDSTGSCCGDGVCEDSESSCGCAPDCGAPESHELVCSGGKDEDCDGSSGCADSDCCSDGACTGVDQDGDAHALCDCDDSNGDAWAPPGETSGLRFGAPGSIEWDAPTEMGATSVTYEVLRFQVASDAVVGFTCLPDELTTDGACSETGQPQPGAIYYYLVRAMNACPNGLGSLGRSSGNLLRLSPACP